VILVDKWCSPFVSSSKRVEGALKMKKISILVAVVILVGGIVLIDSAMAGRFGRGCFSHQQAICRGIATDEATAPETCFRGRGPGRAWHHNRLALKGGNLTEEERELLAKKQMERRGWACPLLQNDVKN
jgi:hypothetical protein